MAIIGSWRNEAVAAVVEHGHSVSNRHAVAGRQRAQQPGGFRHEPGRRAEQPSFKSRRRAARPPGTQVRFRHHSVSFIIQSFQLGFDFLQTVTVTARRRVRRNVQQPADFLERVLVPDFQHHGFALFHRQFRQGSAWPRVPPDFPPAIFRTSAATPVRASAAARASVCNSARGSENCAGR